MSTLNREVIRNSFAFMVLCALIVTSPAIGQDKEKQAPLRGFSAASSAKQVEIEQRFKAMISPEREKEFHRYFTSEPHPAGTPQNKTVAEYIAKTWKSRGSRMS